MHKKGTSTFVSTIAELRSNIPSSSKSVFLCDENTFKHCFSMLGVDAKVIAVSAGETSKSLSNVEEVLNQLLHWNIQREDFLVCLGGGMVTDLGGFIGTIYKRGIQVLYIPTSLLGIVDASVGGKNGIDFHSIKNAVGTFRWVDSVVFPDFLKSLPWSEVQNGYMEMIKHGLIHSEIHFEDSVNHWSQKRLPSVSMMQESIRIKSIHCEEDFNDLGIRHRLNFGHTVGHALEGAALEKNVPLSHGTAVGLGMLVEAQLSQKTVGLSKEVFDQLNRILSLLMTEVALDELSPKDILRFAQQDKKNQGNRISYVGLLDIGKAKQGQHCTNDELVQALEVINLYE